MYFICCCNVCCIVTVTTLHGTLCLVRALIFPFGLLQIVLMCNLVENFIFRLFVLFVCICSCEYLSYV